MTEQPDRNSLLSKWLPAIFVGILGAAILTMVVAIAFYAYHFRGDISADHGRWAEFGDFLGGTLNPFFALLGLLGILLTIILQSQELRNSTRELATSANALVQQSNLARQSSFEGTFFEMIRLYRDIVRELDLSDAPEPAKKGQGRTCFRLLYLEFKESHRRMNSEFNTEGQERIIVEAYSRFFDPFQYLIGHYFRNFHRMLKFVDDSDVEQKTTYTGIIRAQLSSRELALLFCNCLHPVGAKLRPLVDRYAMLENLDLSVLCNPADEPRLIARQAFGDQADTRLV